MSPTPQINSPISLRRMFALGMAAILAIALGTAVYKTFENVDADEIIVVQAPWSGTLTWYTTPGVKWQFFGTVTSYKKRAIYRFDDDQTIEVKDKDGKVVGKKVTYSNGLEVRFYEGGHGTMCGSIQYDMPLDSVKLTAIHTRYGSQEAVQQQIIETSANKAIYHAGPLMTSKESYGEKRNDLIFFVEDQIQTGVYKTRQRDVRVKDPLSGQEKIVTVAEIVMDKDGKSERQEISALAEFGIRAFNFTIKRLPYDETVEAQIQQQQVIAMDVQTSVASAKKAEQRAITVEWEGKANAATAKWKQEEINSKEIAEAEKNKSVASLNAQAAEQYKREQILRGQGDAERKRLVMEADGALEPKLKALVEIAKANADAIKGYQGNWVPGVVFGGNASTAAPGSGAQMLVDMLTANAARQLGVDLGVAGMSKTATEKPASPAPASPVRR